MAADHKFREQKREVERLLRAAGITDYEFIQSHRGHNRVVFYRDGNPREYHVGFANSDDWRASKNSLSDLRRRIEESRYGAGAGPVTGHTGMAAPQPRQQPTGR